MERFTEDMLIRDVLNAHPEAAAVFEGMGLACPGCLAADMETLSSVASMHDIDVAELIAGLDRLLEERDA